MPPNTEIPLFHKLWQEQEVPTALFQALLADDKNALSPSERAEALTQLARCQGLSSEFDAAHTTLDSVPTVDRPTGSTARVRWLLEKGRVLRSSGKAQDPETKACFVAVYNEAAEDFFKADAAHMLAIIDPEGAPEGAAPTESWSSAALEIARASANPNTQMWAASVLNNTAWDAMVEGRPEDALAQFNGARERISRWAVARALRECGRNQEAYDIQTTLWAEAETGPVKDELGILRTLLEMKDPSGADR
ncbi:hypothetical protein B0H11DRAFT_2075174 [Mycena galericulata]|nr:hypothetical protein B0H11DRAFT_2075174 [Mycena galericulata]